MNLLPVLLELLSSPTSVNNTSDIEAAKAREFQAILEEYKAIRSNSKAQIPLRSPDYLDLGIGCPMFVKR